MNKASNNRMGLRLFRNAAATVLPESTVHVANDEEVLACLSAGLLSETEHKEFVSHLATCSICRTELTDMMRSGVVSFDDSESQITALLSQEVDVDDLTDDIATTAETLSLDKTPISFPDRRRAITRWTRAALAIVAALVLMVFLFPSGTQGLRNEMAMAKLELDEGLPNQAFARMKKLLTTNPELSDDVEASQLFEKSGYLTARDKLLNNEFESVKRIESQAGEFGEASARISSLAMQATQEVSSELTLRNQGKLLDYGYEPNGSSLTKAIIPIVDKNTEQLFERYQQLVGKYPLELSLRLNYGQLLMKYRRFRNAGEQFEQALSIGKSNVEAQLGVGVIAFEQKKFALALESFQSVLSQTEDNVQALVNAAVCYEKLGMPSEAEQLWESAILKSTDEQLKVRINEHLGN